MSDRNWFTTAEFISGEFRRNANDQIAVSTITFMTGYLGDISLLFVIVTFFVVDRTKEF